MNRSSFFFAFLLTLLILLPHKTWAWGKKGHALVAEVAFNYLDENTKKTVLHYLDGMSIQEAANWMDNIKSDHSYDYMKPYHYVNFEKGAPVVAVNGANIMYQLELMIKELKNHSKFSDAEMKTKIAVLFHLIGDLHQPLHVGYGFDKGGNDMDVNYNDKKTNLHSLWDSRIIESKGVSLQDCLNSNTFSKKELRKMKKINVIQWSKESRNLLDPIYNTGGITISDEYATTNAKLIETQIHKAGIRLAAVLQQAFKS
jgi:hypothetical protein